MTDHTLAAMRRRGVELTRQNYIYWLYAGEPPDEPLDAEVEATLPEFDE